MISLVIPIFNEAENLPTLYDRITVAAQDWQEDHEIIFVDDGSTDKSLSLLENLHYADRRVKVISFSRNFGHQTAVTAGLKYTHGDAVIVMDADLQDPPEQIVYLLEKWREGYEVVYAVRRKRKEIWLKRWAYACFYHLLAWMASIEIPLDSGDFCLMDRVIVDRLNAMPERNRFIRGLRSWVGYRQIGVPYERHARLAGEAKYTLRKLFRLAFDGFINFSYRPLQLIGAFGFFVALLSFVGIVYVLVARIFDIRINGYSVRQLQGYTSLILSILFIGGVQLISIGILGEYIGRIFDEVKQRPLFIVRKQLGCDRLPSEVSRDINLIS